MTRFLPHIKCGIVQVVRYFSFLLFFSFILPLFNKNEPGAIGYAESCDGVNWTRPHDKPIFKPLETNKWEQFKVSCPTGFGNTNNSFYNSFCFV